MTPGNGRPKQWEDAAGAAAGDLLWAHGPRVPASSLFNGMDIEARAAFAADLEWFSLPGGAVLFERNEPSDALYIVLAGSLGVIPADSADHERTLPRIEAGETVGEIGMLTGVARSATVVALRDTSLLRVSKSAFESLVRLHPAGMLRLLAQLAEWLQRPSPRSHAPRSPKTLAVVPLGAEPPLVPTTHALAEALAAAGKRIIVADAAMVGRTEEAFHALEAAHDLTVYQGEVADAGWTRLCLRRADRIILIANADAHPPDELGMLDRMRQLPFRALDLVLVQSPGRRLPSPAMPWLAKLGVGFHCHVRSGSKADMSRLARYLIGRAVGIAFSGGGARAYGHIGVVKALREAGVPIDLVGGASMGSIIAAGLALEWDDIELKARIRDAFARSDPLSDYAFPFVALTRGRKVARLLREHFGDARVEDLWRPFVAVASNLTTGRIRVQQQGALWRSLKASVAIPGLMPPHIEAGEVLVDGAVMNNLPADIMSGLRRGPVIGVDVARYQRLHGVGEEEQTMFRRWFFPRDQRGAPGIVNLLLSSAMAGSDAQAILCRSHADLLLEPPLQDIDMRDWKALDRAVDAGYRYTAAKLEGDKEVLCRLLR